MTTQQTVAAYYRDAEVRARLLEYCGAADGDEPSAVFVVGLDPDERPYPSWLGSTHVPCASLGTLCDRGWDLSRALWDTRALIFALDLDYQSLDYPGEPFTHASEVFFKLESAYGAVCTVLRHFGLHALMLATGRGYHFVGQIPLDDTVVDVLAELAAVPSWYETYQARRPIGVRAEMTERQARAAMGLALIIEYIAHVVMTHTARHSLIPVVVNGTTVGSGLVGRECVSLDFSHSGDPLDVRHLRMAFSTYQWHRARPDIFGAGVAARPPLVALPRHQRSLTNFLLNGRDLTAAQLAARRMTAVLPDVAQGVERVVDRYRQSPLARFHAEFAAERSTDDATPRVVPFDLPPCITRPLQQPNDLLLKPEYLQNLVRSLLARGWRASEVAAVVLREYERDCGWGDRWTRLDPRTRADFDVRVFAGLVVTGVDPLIDFNCTSSQEKQLCPLAGCDHDLRTDRDRLRARYAS
jgi:hypothetical protein